MSKKIKFASFGVVAGLVLALGTAAPAQAVTVAELQAQINALMAQLTSLQGGAAVSASFTQNLTVGSTGAQVTALQQMLVSGGHLVMPQGVAFGYFGPATKAALVKWQLANGISPASGYFGPLSRAKANAMGGATGGTTTGGTTTGAGSTASGSISTPGAEGTLTVVSAPVSNSTVYEGDMKASVLAFKATAKQSDVAIQRVKLDLGTNSDVYRNVFTKVYLVDDAGNTVASADLNNNTVVKDSDDRYYITLSGFSSIVRKDANRTYTIKMDVDTSIDSADLGSYTVRLAANGVRAIDGAGIDLYSPANATDVSRSITVAADLAESATLTVSTNANTPVSQEVIASAGTNENEADRVVLLTFDIRAEKDDVKITDLKNFVVTRSAGAATASTTYLYEGNGTSGTLLGTASLSGSDADFTDISSTISKGSTKTYTLAADIRSASSVQTTIAASFTGNTTNVVAENSDGDTVSTVTGSATGNSVLVTSAGPVFSLVGAPTISKSATASQNNTSTSTVSATFNVKIKAVGSDVYFGTQSASSTFGFQTYKGGTATTLLVASSTGWSVPSSGVVTSGLSTGQAFKLQENNEVTIPVTFLFEGRTTAGALVATDNYAVGLESIKWSLTGNDTQTSSFMAGKTDWRTPTVSLP